MCHKSMTKMLSTTEHCLSEHRIDCFANAVGNKIQGVEITDIFIGSLPPSHVGGN